MPISTPLISIITLNYNQARVTVDFLESAKKLNYRNFEILVCDMASAEDVTTIIDPSLFPNTHLLLSSKNLGFAAGNNWGMRQAKGEFYLIVNNDTIMPPDLLDKLLQPFSTDPQIGVTCPKIMYYDQPETIQYAGFNPMNMYTGRTTIVGEKEPDTGRHDASGPTSGAHGCAMLVKKSIIEKTGMFPEKFFLYYEEWDWSARILKAGYKIWYTADARIYHKESLSVGKSNPMKVYYHTRNRILFMRRNANWSQLVVFTLFFGLFSFPKSVIQFSVNRQFPQLRNFLKGVFWNLRSSSDSIT
ncbi:MAG: glycosyltransferase family 2 protein [Chitinophagaceae bacterium]|nr:glycosyltransferase family 2 protein [Chitinophagaceae bacterium]